MAASCSCIKNGLRHYKFETCSGTPPNLVCNIQSGAPGPVHYVCVTPPYKKYMKIHVRGYVATSSPSNHAEFKPISGGGISSVYWTQDKPAAGSAVVFSEATIEHKQSGPENIHLEVSEQPNPANPNVLIRIDFADIVFPVTLL